MTIHLNSYLQAGSDVLLVEILVVLVVMKLLIDVVVIELFI
jgi:hypothetical protein